MRCPCRSYSSVPHGVSFCGGGIHRLRLRTLLDHGRRGAIKSPSKRLGMVFLVVCHDEQKWDPSGDFLLAGRGGAL